MNKEYENWGPYEEYKKRNFLGVHFMSHYNGDETFKPAHEGDAGIDLTYQGDFSIALAPGETYAVPTGIKLIIPSGMEAQIRPKSGRALNEGLTVLNTPGTIDEGYRGEIKVILHNARGLTTFVLNQWESNINTYSTNNQQPTASAVVQGLRDALLQETIYINPGQKIAQLVLSKYERPLVEVLTETQYDSKSSTRGADGFGSTGI